MTIPNMHHIAWGAQSWLLFGFANILMGKLVVLWMGHRRGWPFRPFLLILMFSTVGGAVGALLLPSVMGALLGALLFLYVAKRFLDFPYPMEDVLALFLAIVIAIGRLGCLFNGCCFGAPTSLPWGIRYGFGTHAHWLHTYTGQIAPGAAYSLPVHPIQLYETMFMVLAIVILLRLSPAKRRTPAPLLGLLGAYFLFRFGIEFIRDMTNVWWSEIKLGPFSLFQLFLLFSGLALCLGAYLTSRQTASENAPYRPAYAKEWIVALATGLLLLLGHKSFQPIHTIQLFLFGSLWLAMIGGEFKTEHVRKLVPVGLYGLALMALSAVLIPHEVKAFDAAGKKLVHLGDTYHSIQKLSFQGKLQDVAPQLSNRGFFTNLNTITRISGLRYYGSATYARIIDKVTHFDGSVTSYKHKYSGYGIGLEKVARHNNCINYIGLRGGVCFQTEERNDSHVNTYKEWYSAFHIYGNIDRRSFGLGAGLSIINGTYVYNGNATSDTTQINKILPNFYLRLGPPTIRAELGINSRYFQVNMPIVYHFDLAHSFTKKGILRGGVALAHTRTNIVGLIGWYFIDWIPPDSQPLRLSPMVIFDEKGRPSGFILYLDYTPGKK